MLNIDLSLHFNNSQLRNALAPGIIITMGVTSLVLLLRLTEQTGTEQTSLTLLHAAKSTEEDKEETFSLTLPQHAHSQTLHEAAGLARLASPLGDLALVGCRTAVLDVACIV